jgi:hypothetical protein
LGCCSGNEAINLHREGSVELLMLALDYYDHTEDKIEFGTSILPLRWGTTLLFLIISHFPREHRDKARDKREGNWQKEGRLPSVAVTDFVASYYGRTSSSGGGGDGGGGGQLDVWPTQSLEGYRPGSFPPTRANTIQNDMP